MLSDSQVRPLLCRSPLFPGESLSSYLSRLAMANHYEPLSIFATLCRKRLSRLGVRDRLTYPRHPETFELLSSLTCTGPGDLINASAHRLAQAPVLARMRQPIDCLPNGSPAQILKRVVRNKKLHSDDCVQFCPACLRESPCHRLAWSLVEVSTCLKHRCLLVDHCRKCHAWVTVQDIVKCRCQTCGADLAGFPLDDLGDKPFDLFAQEVIQTWWGLRPQADLSSTGGLPDEPAPVLYQIFERLVDSIGGKWRRDYHCRLTEALPPDPHIVHTMALRVLADWPHGFWRFLNDCLQDDLESRLYDYDGNGYFKTGSSFAVWVSNAQQLPDWKFTQKALDQFLVRSNLELSFALWGSSIRIRCTRL